MMGGREKEKRKEGRERGRREGEAQKTMISITGDTAHSGRTVSWVSRQRRLSEGCLQPCNRQVSLPSLRQLDTPCTRPPNPWSEARQVTLMTPIGPQRRARRQLHVSEEHPGCSRGLAQ